MSMNFGWGFFAAVLLAIAAMPAQAGLIAPLPSDVSWDYTDSFWIAISESNYCMGGDGTGWSDPTGNEWDLYWDSDYWTQWFDNGAYDSDRYSVVHLEFTVEPVDSYTMGPVQVVLGWTTPEWSALGLDRPPLSDDFTGSGVSEDFYIERELLVDLPYGTTQSIYPNGIPTLYYDFYYLIPDYNPEWISVGMRSQMFYAEGTIEHSCQPGNDDNIVPEPASITLLGLGFAGLAVRRFRSR